MSASGGVRPSASGVRRRPRGDRVCHQMAMSGILILADNSDEHYKRILAALVARHAGARRLPYAMAPETLDGLPFVSRRGILTEASLIWCQALQVRTVLLAAARPTLAGLLLPLCMDEVRRKVRVILSGTPSIATEA